VKTTYLKNALRFSRHNSSRLAGESLLTEEMQYQKLLPFTNAANKLITQRRKKEKQTRFKFYSTEAMINRDWTRLDEVKL
jgi:hypothetical protein